MRNLLSKKKQSLFLRFAGAISPGCLNKCFNNMHKVIQTLLPFVKLKLELENVITKCYCIRILSPWQELH